MDLSWTYLMVIMKKKQDQLECILYKRVQAKAKEEICILML